MTELKPQMYADAAASSLRRLNLLTFAEAGYEWPADVDMTIAELHSLVLQLPQALYQAGRFLTVREEEGGVSTTTGADPRDAVAEVLHHLQQANSSAAQLAVALEATHQLTARLRGAHAPGKL